MCKDPMLSYINGLGYNVVRHPRARLSPLYLIGRRDGVNEGLGPLEKLVKPSERKLPRIRLNVDCASVEGKTTGQLSADVGIGILSPFLKELGVNVDLSAQLSGLRKLKFRFHDVKSDETDLLDIGQFLDGAEADMGNPVVRSYLSRGGEVYVLHEVIKSPQMEVVFDQSDADSLAVKLPAIEKTFEGKVGVSVKREQGLSLSFTGNKPLVFGFKCLKIWLKEENGRTTFETSPVAANPRVHLGEAQDDDLELLIRDELVELDGPEL